MSILKKYLITKRLLTDLQTKWQYMFLKYKRPISFQSHIFEIKGNILLRINSSTRLNERTMTSSESKGYYMEKIVSNSEDIKTKLKSDKQENAKQLTFVSRPNTVTGKMDWVLQEEDYDFTQEIARSGYGDMLHDTDRNVKYYEAIRKTVTLMKSQGREVNVLDIGTGTGLLSMMAATAGADSVTACEAFPPMAECAEKVLKTNHLNNKIKLVPKRSTELLLDDLPQRANLLVTELFDTELIGEGAIWSYKDSLTRHMEDNCYAVPSRARIYVQAVESDMLRQHNDLHIPCIPGVKDMSMPSEFSQCSGAPSLHDLQADQLHGEVTLMSQPMLVFSFDFTSKDSLVKNENCQVQVKALSSGRVDALLMWWDLDMDPEGTVVLSCGPQWCRAEGEDVPWRDHWMQAVYYPSSTLPVVQGDLFPIHASHDEYSLWFDTAKGDSQRPVCTCGLHIAFSRNRLAQLNDEHRNSVFVKALQKHLSPTSVCLVISDGSLLPLVAAGLGAKHVFYLDSNPSCRRLIKQVIDHNNLQGQITVLGKDAEELTSLDFHNLKIDIVIAEPFFQASSLPWEHLYFWYAVDALRDHMAPGVEILPRGMQIKAVALKFRDLHKIRIPVGDCEGFDISEFDKLIEKSSDSADSEVEPQPLWEYPAWPASQPIEILSLDFSHPVDQASSLSLTSRFDLFSEETVNGVAYWTEVDLGDDLRLSTGLQAGEVLEKGKPVSWDKHTKQGVQLFRQPLTPGERKDLDLNVTFTPQSGDVAIKLIWDRSNLLPNCSTEN